MPAITALIRSSGDYSVVYRNNGWYRPYRGWIVAVATMAPVTVTVIVAAGTLSAAARPP